MRKRKTNNCAFPAPGAAVPQVACVPDGRARPARSRDANSPNWRSKSARFSHALFGRGDPGIRAVLMAPLIAYSTGLLSGRSSSHSTYFFKHALVRDVGLWERCCASRDGRFRSASRSVREPICEIAETSRSGWLSLLGGGLMKRRAPNEQGGQRSLERSVLIELRSIQRALPQLRSCRYSVSA